MGYSTGQNRVTDESRRWRNFQGADARTLDLCGAMFTSAKFDATSSSNKRLAWPTMDAFGIRAILPRPKGQRLPRVQIKRC
jgi:hypothetical protein